MGDVGILGVVIVHVHDRTADSNDYKDNSGEGTKDRHDSDLLEGLHGNKGDSDNGSADPDPGLLVDGISFNKSVHLSTGQDHVHNGSTEDNGCVEEPDGNEARETVGMTTNLLVRGETVLAVVVKALHQEDGSVDRHQEREQQDADTDPATQLQSVRETESTGTCCWLKRRRGRNGRAGLVTIFLRKNVNDLVQFAICFFQLGNQWEGNKTYQQRRRRR